VRQIRCLAIPIIPNGPLSRKFLTVADDSSAEIRHASATERERERERERKRERERERHEANRTRDVVCEKIWKRHLMNSLSADGLEISDTFSNGIESRRNKRDPGNP